MEDEIKNSTATKKVIDIKPGSRKSKFFQFEKKDELLHESARIKSQRDVILERISKMEDHQDRVSNNVFEKVKRDYLLQLESINHLFQEKKELLKKEVKELYLYREKLTVEINRHKEILEEAQFRHMLSEFTQNQFQEVENYENKEITQLETDLANIYQLIRIHEDLFDPEDLGLPPRKKNKPAPEVTKTVHAKEIKPQPPVQELTQAKAEPEVIIPAKKSEETVIKAPEPVKEASPEAASFADLFNDNNADEIDQLEESQSNIEKILKDESSLIIETQQKKSSPEEISEVSVSSMLSEPSDQDSSNDYFKQEKVNESSLNLFKEETDNNIQLPPESLTSSDSSTQITDKSVNKGTQTDVTAVGDDEDSISEILESIQIQGEEYNTGSAQAGESTAQDKSLPGDYILSLIEGDLDTREFILKDNTSIGRSPSNDVTLKAPKVSRQHAAINKYNNQYIIIDLKSSNGVYVNGAKVDEYVLKEGDEVSVGGYRFTFKRK